MILKEISETAKCLLKEVGELRPLSGMQMVINSEKGLISMFLSPLMILEHFTGVITIAPSAFCTSDCSLGQLCRKPVCLVQINTYFHGLSWQFKGGRNTSCISFLPFPFPPFFILDMAFVQTHISSHDPSIQKEKTDGIVNLHTEVDRTLALLVRYSNRIPYSCLTLLPYPELFYI